jgi:periplasmic copper chaperone A
MMVRFFSVLFLLFFSFPTFAEDVKHNLYSHPTATGMKIGAVFGVLPSVDVDDVLVSASTPICDHVEIHTMSEENGIFKMRKIEKLSVEGGQKNLLEPSGYHLMLMNLKAPLTKDETFPLTLTFEKAGKKTVTISVVKRGNAAKND